MRILLDECLPKQLRGLLTSHSVTTVTEAGWVGMENGELAELARDRFDVILTADKRFATSAGKSSLSVAIIILRAEANKLESLQPLIPHLLDALKRIQPGETMAISEHGPA